MRLILLSLLIAAKLSAQGEMVPISHWRTQAGDDARWAHPDFDDSGWTEIPKIPSDSNYETRKQQAIWYRTTVKLPDWWKGRNLAFGLNWLADTYEVFVNGQRVGGFGSMPPAGTKFGDGEVVAFVARPLSFPISPEVVDGGTVTIALRRWRLRVANGLGSHQIVMSRPDSLPVVGLAVAVTATYQARTLRGYLRNLPNIALWSLTLVSGVICLGLRRKREDNREFLWLGWSLIAAGANPLVGIPLGLTEWLPKNSLAVFLWTFMGNVTPVYFFGLFLAELAPRWKRMVQLASLPIALGGSLFFVSIFFAQVPLEAALSVRVPSFSALIGLSLAVAWSAWKLGRTELLAPILAISLRSGAYVLSTLAPGFNLITIGPFPISLRFATDAIVGVALVTMLYSRLQRERTRQAEMAQDMAAAREVQQILLGTGNAATPGFTVDAVYRPAQEVGGDFYQIAPALDESLLVVVGDVSGKGLKASMVVASIIGSLRNQVSRRPGEVLALLNRSVIGHTGGGFVTCCAALFQSDGRVAIANAGHLSPYLGGVGVQVESGLPLGLVAEVEYTEITIDAGEAAMTLLSDGVVEAANAKGELFGFDRTRDISGKSASEIADAAKMWGQNDDITVVTVRRQNA